MKILHILFLLILMSGCSNLKVVNSGEETRKIQWLDGKQVIKKLNRLKVGDIVVKNKVATSVTSWFGHAAVVISPWSVGEYPMIGAGFVEANILEWLYEDRKVVVLRYKYFDKKFRNRFLNNVKRYSNREYQITTDKYNNRKFYCSQYVWYLYYETAKELKDKNFDYNFKKNDIFIFPYDLLDMPNFEIVDMR